MGYMTVFFYNFTTCSMSLIDNGLELTKFPAGRGANCGSIWQQHKKNSEQLIQRTNINIVNCCLLLDCIGGRGSRRGAILLRSCKFAENYTRIVQLQKSSTITRSYDVLQCCYCTARLRTFY